jgi:5-aminolevulinate synthase
VKYLKEHNEIRVKHQERASKLKQLLKENELPLMSCSTTHIVPVLVGDAKKCKSISDLLLNEYNIYVQPINHPTVPVGTERLRFAPTPYHDDTMMMDLIAALKSSFQ